MAPEPARLLVLLHMHRLMPSKLPQHVAEGSPLLHSIVEEGCRQHPLSKGESEALRVIL